MNLIKDKPISAFCILCHDADAVLPFYIDVLGFEPRRIEESFISLDRRGTATTLCLWEIGHVAHHTVYDIYDTGQIPNKVMLSLTLLAHADANALHQKLMEANIQFLTSPTEHTRGEFTFIDPCAMLWEVRVKENAQDGDKPLALDRITLICQDLATMKSFYEEKLYFPPTPIATGRVEYAAIDGTALSLWSSDSAAKALGLSALQNQPTWSAHTAMIAFPYDTLPQMQAVYTHLKELGVAFDEAPAFFDWDFNAAYFRDPENNIWELFEMPNNIEERNLPQTKQS